MTAQRKTVALAAVAVLLLALNLVDQGTGSRIADQLPTIEAIPRDEATRIEISTAVQKIVLEGEAVEGAAGAGEDKRLWRVTAPIQAEADQVAVRTLLKNFRKDVALDVKVDDGNLEEYGLDATNGLVVEIWRGEGEPATSFTIGFDGPGGTSFVRMSGEEAVYRARLGGRHRYEKKPAEWRNRVLLDFESGDVAGLTVTQGGQTTLVIERAPSAGTDAEGNPAPGAWALSPDPGWAVDQTALGNLVASLGALRAGEILGDGFNGGFDPPAAVIEVGLQDGTTRALEVGTRDVGGGGAFVRQAGKPTVFRVARPVVDAARLPVEVFRNRTMFAFARGDIDTYALEEGGRTRMLLQQDLATNLWNVIEPPNTDVDIKNVFFSINTMAQLRADDIAEGVTPADAGLRDPAARVIAHRLDGRDLVLELGRRTRDSQNRPVWTARVGGDQTVYLLRDPVVERIRQGFGVD